MQFIYDLNGVHEDGFNDDYAIFWLVVLKRDNICPNDACVEFADQYL
jgi:hypothetical protein